MTEPFMILEDTTFLDYFDDGGTNMGVTVAAEHVGGLAVTIRHSIPDDQYDPNHRYSGADHPIHRLLGRRVRVTVDDLGPATEGQQ